MASIHDRMPVILPPQHYDRWLDPDVQDPQQLLPRLQPDPANEMETHPVGFLVNSPKNDRRELIEPV